MAAVEPIPERMRVARLYRWGDVRVEEAPVPRPGPGEVLVRIEACGVCGTDALVWYVERKAPAVLGHEPAGVVVEVGDGVESVRAGDRVFVHHHAPCMACAECRRGLWSSCATWRATSLDPGGFAEYARVPAVNVERDTLVLPDGLSFDEAVFIEPLATCIRAVRRQGRLERGDGVLIIGLGAMGLLMVSTARAYGAGAVLGSDFVAGRRDLALRRGAAAAFDPAAEDVAAAVRAQTGGRGADVVVVCPGDARAIRAGLEAAAPGGRVVCFTPLAPGESLALDASPLYFREVTLTQSYSCGPDETREALRLIAAREVEVASLITHRVGLEGVGAALERAKGRGEGIKTVVYPGRAAGAGPGER
ncbi:MAG TPA: alcohol dehydrogenase catalytic domain-containing protein [Longimicrobiales bacterium]